MIEELDSVEFDDLVLLALAEAAGGGDVPGPQVKDRLMARVAGPALPAGFSVVYGGGEGWAPHPVPGIRMKVLALNKASGYATVIFDVAPGTSFPEHHHAGAEECYVLSGSLFTCGRRLGPGDFVHADSGTDHGELYTVDGCSVLLVVAPEDYFPPPSM